MSFSPPLINPTNGLPESEYSTTRDQPFRLRWFRFYEDGPLSFPLSPSVDAIWPAQSLACQRVGKPQLCYGATASLPATLHPFRLGGHFLPRFPTRGFGLSYECNVITRGPVVLFAPSCMTLPSLEDVPPQSLIAPSLCPSHILLLRDGRPCLR
jgi:hypothetical protein